MTGDKLKRIMFVVLLLAFAGIWGYNMTLFLPKSEESYLKKAVQTKSIESGSAQASVFNFSWGYNLPEKVSDPFIPFYKRTNLAPIPDTNQVTIIPEIVIDQPFRYLGLIKGSKRVCGIIADRGGRTYVVAPGDTLEFTKIIKVNDKLLKLKYQGKEFELELNE